MHVEPRLGPSAQRIAAPLQESPVRVAAEQPLIDICYGTVRTR
jgi:hypothetical protein